MKLRQIVENEEEFDLDALLKAAEDEFNQLNPPKPKKKKVMIPRKVRGPYKQNRTHTGTSLRGGSWATDTQRDRRLD